MTHVMLDIETLGTKAGNIVLSVGAATFDPFGEGHTFEFYQNIDPQDSKRHGFTVDPRIAQWWREQDKAAQDALTVDRMPLNRVMKDFKDWFSMAGGEQVWSQGANFDPILMEPVFNCFGFDTPWKFYNVRDTRTVYDVCNFDSYSVKREGTYHNALDDCKHQIKCVQLALKSAGIEI